MAATADQGHQLLDLDGTNFTWAMRAYPRMLLFFYAPWCGHSRTLEPEVRKAAEILQGTVAVAKIDASLEVEVADEFGIAAYPGLFLLQKGSYEEFSGRRAAASLVDWVRSKVGPALELMNSTEQLQDALKGRGVHSAAVAKGQLGLKEIMTRLAERNRAWGKFFFLTEGEGNQVQVFRGLDEVVSAPFEVDIDRQALELDLYKFLQAEQLPVFGEISQDNFYHYETSGADGLLWVIFANNTGLPCWGVQCQQQAEEHASDFRSLAGRYPHLKVVYVDAAAHQDYIVEDLGLSRFPALLLQKGTLSAMDSKLETFTFPWTFQQPLELLAVYRWIEEVFGMSKV